MRNAKYQSAGERRENVSAAQRPDEGIHTPCRLPEDLALKQAALERGYAVVAVSSQETCWDSSFPPENSVDAQIVKKVIGDVRARESLQELPVYALGASSGGYFISVRVSTCKPFWRLN